MKLFYKHTKLGYFWVYWVAHDGFAFKNNEGKKIEVHYLDEE